MGAWTPRDDFVYAVVLAGEYEIATYQKISEIGAPVHIYVEGDGHAFNARGVPTDNPTPRGDMMRNLAMRDISPNVVYMARPCQFIMSSACDATDWTDGRFSAKLVDAMAGAVRNIAGSRPVVLVGYSGGGMMTGLIISRHPEIQVQKWITIAGVPNHTAWTKYFGDSPLTKSLDLKELPNVPAVHYIGTRDRVVPPELSHRFFPSDQIVEIPGAAHTGFENINLNFN